MTQQNSNIQQNDSSSDEIDLMALAKTLWDERRTVIKITIIFMIIGLFVAVFSEKKYSASTTFIPQTTDSKIGGSLGGLAAMAGINLGGMNSDSGIPPSLYPQILNSIPFQKELLQTPLTFENHNEKITFEEYYLNVYTPSLLGYIKKYTLGLPRLLISAIKGEPTEVTLSNNVGNKNLQIVSLDEDRLMEILDNRVSLEVNEKEGYVSISANMPEALASAELALKVQELLQHYVIDFKIQKSKEQLEFLKTRYFEVEEKFKTVQQKLANTRDRNQNITTAMAQTTIELLQDEYDLAYGVYSELAKQLEAQYIQVTENTPVFTVLKPVTIPWERSEPKRFLILFLWSIFGVVTGVILIFGKDYLIGFKKVWNEKTG